MTSLTIRLAWLLLLLDLSCPSALRAQAKPTFLQTKLTELNPASWVRTAATHYREGRWIARDLSEHGSFGAALKRSVMPTDRAANMRSVGTLKLHGLSLAQTLLRPAIIELQRQAASGEGFDGAAFATAMHPVPIATTFAASWAGATAGAALQSSLTAFGPAGAVAGVFARAAGGIGGSLIGYAFGKNLVEGKSFGEVLRASVSELRLGRDGGNIVGSTIGGILGQTLIPVPVVGGIIGSLIGGTIGIAIGEGISAWWERRGKFQAMAARAPLPAGAPADANRVQLLGQRAGS